MHNRCCACAYQLLCKRTTAVVRPKILTVSTTYPISSNNLFYLFQQHILSLSATYPIFTNDKKRVNHKLMTHPSLFVDEVAASITLAIFLQKLDNVFGILANVLFVSVISLMRTTRWVVSILILVRSLSLVGVPTPPVLSL